MFVTSFYCLFCDLCFQHLTGVRFLTWRIDVQHCTSLWGPGSWWSSLYGATAELTTSLTRYYSNRKQSPNLVRSRSHPIPVEVSSSVSPLIFRINFSTQHGPRGSNGTINPTRSGGTFTSLAPLPGPLVTSSLGH